jgi:Flp pilus assembly protein TadG
MGKQSPALDRKRGLRARLFASECGQSMVELGMMLPLILVLVIGVIEVNNALNAYITVVNSSRDGARLGSKGAASVTEIQALVVKDLERLPNTTASGNVSVTYPTVSSTNAIKVRSCYDHTTILQVPLIMPGTFQMCASTTMPKLN